MNVHEFIERAELTCEKVRLLGRTDLLDPWPETATHWQVRLTCHDRSLITYYSCGSGHHEDWFRGLSAPKQGALLRRAGCELPLPPRHSVAYQDVLRIAAQHWPGPSLAAILELLACDRTDAPFEDWCQLVGYDVDSRRAAATYDAIRRSTADLHRVLGGYYPLLDEIEWED